MLPLHLISMPHGDSQIHDQSPCSYTAKERRAFRLNVCEAELHIKKFEEFYVWSIFDPIIWFLVP
jgi:hypothetical protein